jgi:mono/diheme cytochrome c family protein
LLALVLTSGCDNDEAYSRDLRYPLRTDLLVKETGRSEPPFPDPPGHLEENIAKIDRDGGKTFDPRSIPGKVRGAINSQLTDLFGTPAAPKVEASEEVVDRLGLAPATLKAGSTLYRRHCLTCHGVPGDGRGPTGPWVSPHPRDYRQGIFKFISTNTDVAGRKPRRADLLRTLRNGIDGTTMPSFNVLKDEELQALVSYVIHLSLRGEVEYETMMKVITEKADEGSVPDIVADNVTALTKFWSDSNDDSGGKNVLEPDAYPPQTRQQHDASVRHGYEVFTNPEGAASCIGCHRDFGRQVNFRYDSWGTLVRPANLTAGIYRGGRRPVDLYWRIRGGIPGSGMSAATNLKRDEYWDVVNFLQALPYPDMLPQDIREKVYPAPLASEGAGQHAAAR